MKERWWWAVLPPASGGAAGWVGGSDAMSLHPMSGERIAPPTLRHEVGRLRVDPDLPLIARVDPMMVEGAQEHTVVDVGSSVVPADPLDVVSLGPSDGCGAAGP